MNHLAVIGPALREFRGFEFYSSQRHHFVRPSDGSRVWKQKLASLQRQVDCFLVHTYMTYRDPTIENMSKQGVYVTMDGVYGVRRRNGIYDRMPFKPMYATFYMDKELESVFLARLAASCMVFELFMKMDGRHYKRRIQAGIQIQVYDINRYIA